MEQELLVVLHSVKCQCRGASWVAMPATVVSSCPDAAGRVVLSFSDWKLMGKPRNAEEHALVLARATTRTAPPVARIVRPSLARA